MTRTVRYRIGQVAELSGVSVRTLHHYDDIGLLVPGTRTESGYRLYDHADLLRLQQIVINRELGLSLDEIRRMLDDPAFDRRQALLSQRASLAARAASTERMLRAVDHALAMTEEEPVTMKELFDGFDPAEYDAEAKERWGGTDAYRESMRRTATYSPEDWTRLSQEQASILDAAAAAMAAGRSPSDPDVLDIAEEHRQSLCRWFYDCPHAMHAALADGYEADPRFAAHFERHAPGLAAFLADAIRANSARNDAEVAPGG